MFGFELKPNTIRCVSVFAGDLGYIVCFSAMMSPKHKIVMIAGSM